MIEEKEIFSNKVFLTFQNENVNTQYNLKNKEKMVMFNKISFALLGLLSITIDIILLIKKYPKNCDEVDKKKLFYYILLVLTFFLTVCQIILFVLSFIFTKKISVQIALTCISYCFITLEFTILKIMIEVIFLSDWQDYFFLNIIDYLVRIMIHFLGIVEFIQSIVINIILTGLILTLYYAVDSVNSIISDSGATFIILNLGLVLCSYFITRSSKNTFYYCYEIEDLNKKKDSILNNLNTGYMRVRNNEIRFMNIALVNTVKSTKAISSAVSSSSNNLTSNSTRMELDIGDEWLYSHKEFIYDILFSGISPPRINLCSEDRINTHTVLNYDSFMKAIAECYTKISNDNAFSAFKTPYTTTPQNSNSKFIFLDYHNLTMANGKKITYEVSYRYDYDEYEFIFNDITRTKEFEHREYDIKIKNIFLTKIAHEFKNPLVCLTELITQIKEYNNEDKCLIKKCNLGKWLCEYLLILIKDLDYFSLENESITCAISREKINIDALVQFCLAIGNRQIKILNKENQLTFTSHIDDNVPKEILCDDVKLKQILLNLISNAIKFTSTGGISLDISKENELIKFKVTDTGKGIPKQLQKTLLTPSKNDKSQIGGGLTIVKELTSLIGNEIRFISEEQRGSSFWFTVPINGISRAVSPTKKILPQLDSNLSILNSSNSTVKVDTFPLELSSPYNKLLTEKEKEKEYNIIITDDEDLARKALIRVLKEAAKKLRMNINFIEASDGMELLYLVYENSIKNNIQIDGIISDQTMNYVNGSVCQQILCNCTNIKKLIPFFIVTAYDVNATYFRNLNLEGIFSKPLRKCDAENILSHFIT